MEKTVEQKVYCEAAAMQSVLSVETVVESASYFEERTIPSHHHDLSDLASLGSP